MEAYTADVSIMTPNDEHFDAYYFRRLSYADTKHMEEALATQPSLQQDYHNYLRTVEGILLSENRQLKKALIGTPQLARTRRFPPNSVYYSAAAVIILVMCYIGFVLRTPVNYQQLFEEHYEIYPNLEQPIQRSGTATNNPYAAYEYGDYTKSAQQLTTLYQEDPAQVAYGFYAALSLIELERYQEAKALLEQTLASESKYYSSAQWYMSLLCLKLEDPTCAKAMLNTLKSLENGRGQKARAMLKAIQ